jgi:signal peptidase I
MYKQSLSAGSKISPIPPEHEGSEAQDCGFFYHGSSMLGTFRPGDRLTVAPVSFADLRPGDVAVFRGANPQNDSDTIVHRVMALGPAGLVTRGDNAPIADRHLLVPANLVGRVTHVERGGGTRPVSGARLGLLRARVLHARRPIMGLIAIVGRKPYRWLRTSGLVRRLWRPTITKSSFRTGRGQLVKYVCGGRTVAWWWPEEGRFECRQPYDLLISPPAKSGSQQD